MVEAFLIVAVVLFALAAIMPRIPDGAGWTTSVTNAGLAFFAASFLAALKG